MDILIPLRPLAPLQPPAAFANPNSTETDAGCAQIPDPGKAIIPQERPEDRTAAPELGAQQLEEQQTLVSHLPELTVETVSKPYAQIERPVTTAAAAAEREAAETAAAAAAAPQITDESQPKDPVSLETSSDQAAEPASSRESASTAQALIEHQTVVPTKREEPSTYEPAHGICHESEVQAGAADGSSAVTRDPAQHPAREDSSVEVNTAVLAQAARATGVTAATSSSLTPDPAETDAHAQVLETAMGKRDPERLMVTLRCRPGWPQPTEPAGASSDSPFAVDMAVTPPSQSQLPEQTQTSRATTTPERQIICNKENFAPGLYARERNKRRNATKAFREVPTPKKAPAPVEVDAPRTMKPPQTMAPPQSKAGPKPVKRKVAEPEEPAPKRRKGSEGSTKSATRRNTQDPAVIDQLLALAHTQPDAGQRRPNRDQQSDELFAEQTREVLKVQVKIRRADMGKRQATRILELLELAEYPNEEEALFLTTEEATAAVAQGRFTKHIIVTAGQQRVPLQTVDEFLGEYYDEDALVWIQDPEVRPTKKAPITRQVKVSQVKERFAAESTNKPWNLLELATHCDDGLRPAFLNNEDCRLLTKLKIPEAHPEARRRTYLPGYKEVEKWALVAEAGALTEPHQDSHGYSTFITINTGLVGFGWLSNPSEAERNAWRRNPSAFRGGSWRYIVLKPGQTVYFPAGTVHFVFRLPAAGNTLAFGGHVLRCSTIVHWVRTLIEERDQKDVTNEDLTDSAPGYLGRVEKFVNQARVNGTMEKWGGEESIGEFLRLKKEFLSRKQK